MKAILACFCSVFGLIITGGCGSSGAPETVLVSGTVTLDGVPVAQGMVTFKATGETEKTYAGKIKDGKFEFPSTVGQKRVEINSEEDVVGQKGVPGNPGDPVSAENPVILKKNIIPPKYNSSSDLEANVISAGPNSFTFDLKRN